RSRNQEVFEIRTLVSSHPLSESSSSEPRLRAISRTLSAALDVRYCDFSGLAQACGSDRHGQKRTSHGVSGNASCSAVSEGESRARPPRSASAGEISTSVHGLSKKAFCGPVLDFPSHPPSVWLEVLGVYLWRRGPRQRDRRILGTSGHRRHSGLWPH